MLANASNGDAYTFNANAAAFTMPHTVAYGAAYAVTVSTQPTGLSCAVNQGSGTMAAGNVALVVTCAHQAYPLGGTVTSNAPGSGAGSLNDLGLVLTNTGNGDNYAFGSNANNFTMALNVPYGAAYAITLSTQPTGLDCSVSNASATMPASAVTKVAVSCAARGFSLGGTITGLGSASGLILSNEGGDATAILANATLFTMNTAVPYGAPYDVAVKSHPTAIACSLTQGAGTMPAAAVSNVAVGCGPGTESVLWSFGGSGDGQSPYEVMEATDGNFYGTTQNGGANSLGTVFKITQGGAESTLWFFGGGTTDGRGALGDLIQASDGNLYGTTAGGGAHGLGKIFKFD